MRKSVGNNVFTILLFFSILCLSAVSFPGVLQKIGVVFYFLVFYLANGFKSFNLRLSLVLFFVFIIMYSLARFLIAYVYENWLYLETQNIIITFFLNFSFYVLFLFVSYHSFNNDALFNPIQNSLSLVLVFHLVFFYVQFIFVYTGDEFIDYIYYFTGEESRYITYIDNLKVILPYRSTGLFIEPSTYAGVMLLLLYSYINLSLKPSYILCFFVLSSIFLTFSSAAMFFIVVFLISIFVQKLDSYYHWCSHIFIFLLFLVFIGFVFYLQNLTSDATVTMRAGLVNYTLNRDVNLLFLGPGLFSIEDDLFKASSGESFSDFSGDRLASINDLGLGGLLLIRMGLFGFFIYVLSFLFVKDKLSYLNITLTKLSFMHPLFLFAFNTFLNKKFRDK